MCEYHTSGFGRKTDTSHTELLFVCNSVLTNCLGFGGGGRSRNLVAAIVLLEVTSTEGKVVLP